MYDLGVSKKKPLYHKVSEVILKEIGDGKYKPDDQLPTEMELCKRFAVSRITIRQALEQLERGNYIYRKLGIGTFVSGKLIQQELKKFYSFTDEMIKIGKTPKSEILGFKKILCDEKISGKLNVEMGTSVFHIQRLRLADDIPMLLEHTYLPAARFKGLSESRLKEQAMYTTFKNDYSVIFSKAIETFQSALIREDEGRYLGVQKGIHGMMIERYTFEWDSIIEYTLSIARGDKFIFRVVLD